MLNIYFYVQEIYELSYLLNFQYQEFIIYLINKKLLQNSRQ